MQESNFQSANEGSQKWQLGNYSKITMDYPVKIVQTGKGNKTELCSSTDMAKMTQQFMSENPAAKENEFPGWCASETDSKNRIVRMGLCSDQCKSAENGLQFAAVNLLMDDECNYLFGKNDMKVRLTLSILKITVVSNLKTNVYLITV